MGRDPRELLREIVSRLQLGGGETEGGRYARALRAGKPDVDVFVLAPAALTKLETDLEKKEPEKREPVKDEGGEKAPEKEPEKESGDEGEEGE